MENSLQVQPNSLSSQITGLMERFPVVYQFMRFGCIGLLNTALNFLILNAITKALGISQGWGVGAVDVISFSAAVVQSYLWNRTWTFGGETNVGILKNLIRLALVGALGALAIVLVFIASKASAPYLYYVGILAVYLIFESVLWRSFGFHISNFNHESHSFVLFFIVTLIGLGINASLASIISSHLHLTNLDLDKNIALALATGASLFWNFVGYKLLVFKK